MTKTQYQPWLSQLNGWTVVEEKAIRKNFVKANFTKALEFVNQIAAIAESEGHHPDLRLHDWKQVEVTLSTHAIGGLSENDFILAAKIEAIAPNP